jgi:hypothetical protein
MHLKSLTPLILLASLLTLSLPQQPQPIPALDRLKIFLGRFDVTETYDKSSIFPNAGTAHGLYKAHSGPGNYSQIEDFWAWGGPEGDISGHQVITWDPDAKALKRYTFGNSFPLAFVSTGNWQSDTLAFDGDFDFQGTKFHFHDASTADPSGAIIMKESFQTGDSTASPTPMLTMTGKKAPAAPTASVVPAAEGTPHADVADRTTSAQPPPAPTKKDLSPGLQKMAFLVGTWHYTEKFEKSGMTRDGGTGEGNYTALVGPGGQSIITDFAETAGPLAGISAHEVFTWDEKAGNYTGYSFVSNAPGCFTRTGTFANNQLTFTREIPMPGKKFLMRFVYSQPDPDTIVIQTFSARGDSPLTLSFTTSAKRQQ